MASCATASRCPPPSPTTKRGPWPWGWRRCATPWTAKRCTRSSWCPAAWSTWWRVSPISGRRSPISRLGYTWDVLPDPPVSRGPETLSGRFSHGRQLGPAVHQFVQAALGGGIGVGQALHLVDALRLALLLQLVAAPGQHRLGLGDLGFQPGQGLGTFARLALAGRGAPGPRVAVGARRRRLRPRRLFLALRLALPRRLVLIVIALEDVQTAVAYLPNLRGQPLDQVAVVRDQQQRACEALQHLLQHLLRGDIQVIGRLVQQQQVGVLDGQDGQGQAPALAAAEHAHLLEDILAAEQVERQVVARLVQGHIAVAQQLVEDRLLRVEPLVRLREVADLQPRAEA